MWIFDKLFNRKIEGKSSLDDLAENVVVNKETNTTEVGGNLNVNGTITQNGQPIVDGGKVYLHNIYIDAGYKGYIKLYTTNNEPFTKDTLVTFMVNNGITSRLKGFPLCYNSVLANADNVTKSLLFNFIVYASGSALVINTEGITFNIVENNVVLTRNENPYNYATSITDTVIEL